MKHYVLTRSAYGSAWDRDANARRLEVTRGVTVASMAAQSNRDWEWLVAIDRADPLMSERMAVFAASGVRVRYLEVRSSSDRSRAAVEAYRAPWEQLLGCRDEQVAMTRLDDDDALADWAVERIQRAAAAARVRTVLMLPRGLRAWDGRVTVVRHDSNAMQTLVTPAGDTLHVYAYPHRKARAIAPIRTADSRIAWVWSRHPDTISGWHAAEHPIDARIRAFFPAIDWSLFGEPKTARAKTATVGRYFR